MENDQQAPHTIKAPNEIRLSADRSVLTVSFDDNESHQLSAELLRVESPSAEVQGHDPSAKKIVPAKKDVIITGIESVGNYAIRIIFDDGHNTGIYSWAVLYRLIHEGDALWQNYLAALEERHLSR